MTFKTKLKQIKLLKRKIDSSENSRKLRISEPKLVLHYLVTCRFAENALFSQTGFEK